MPLIELDHVVTIFGNDPEGALARVRAGADKKTLLAETNHVLGLDDITLSIEAGEIFVVMGLSGSGKSTLVRHINRLIDSTAGAVRIDGTDIMALSKKELIALRRRRIAMVFQRFGLLPHRRVLENAAYGLEIRGLPKAEREARSRDWLERVGLKGYEDRYPGELSGGMQQRVGLARALAADTDIILMDEAFSALDPLIRSELQDELVALQRATGKTIVFITHDLDEALRLADRIAILKDGRLVQVGTPTDILLSPADPYVEAFVRDVNRARALTVDSLMQPPALRLSEESIGEALAAMRRTKSDVAYVVDDGRFAGVVTKEGLERAAVTQGAGEAVAAVAEAHPAVTADTAIESAIPTLLESPHPLPVVTEDGDLAGIVRPESVSEVLVSERTQADLVESAGAGEAAASRRADIDSAA
ncbi:quaternary amine ABC transporter ATP-binding protein [Chelatococcus composti]|uniref:Quaternary amine transport ATP-binding protein n=1 Tax=Chelatococcus composti TaxID=1743235 RepID=A0A841K9G5_9HYPH|nr:glycine betaine/L-proline ABC transporter ATP-binding protein [Chelatococcus composti]MBB6168750.1 glycine betaine/proline transport system ATP-binding protein [Chelatococcus composti]MBS7737357.1 glycine betaine/L-proline ABC transporter ATP-binding protein [Chelatococcus composti]GGG42543.1 ABC transporter ATP-binding protein [Chelatococcus composti]